MIDESASTLSPSVNAGMRPSGLSFLNSALGGKGEVCSCSNGRFFSASTTLTFLTNGDGFAPSSFNIEFSSGTLRYWRVWLHRVTDTLRVSDATSLKYGASIIVKVF